MSKMSEHARDVEVLSDEVWRSIHRLQNTASPLDLTAHLETLEMAQASLSAIIGQIMALKKKAA